ncbi:hypothetical protein L1077_04930 [Pseudoalteromonas luteoviolacea]|uniref:hypothetical protein n=1 Tax=Pseudoalteromonas luteoviolacea TaxID=43657 RepID=UPI001F1B7782|nr:hypothetical protein [Pseudoalteromonas luteoviolacea]MCF6438774.1 hypothetical protein [Pseudoalteromonas luteoviolacea]
MRKLTVAFTGFLTIASFDSFAALNMQQYEFRALQDAKIPGRCVYSPISYNQVKLRIDWALGQGLITERASYWGKAYGYYPIVDMFSNQVAAVCKGDLT